MGSSGGGSENFSNHVLSSESFNFKRWPSITVTLFPLALARELGDGLMWSM